MKYSAKRCGYWSKDECDPRIVITEATADRVKGCYTGGESLITDFDVKLVGDRFSLGSGSGKTRYKLVELKKS